MTALFAGLGKLLFGGGTGAPKVENHVSAITPPAPTDQAVQDTLAAQKALAARAAGRASTVATSPQGDTSALPAKKTLLGGA
jgi:hypothetical protein